MPNGVTEADEVAESGAEEVPEGAPVEAAGAVPEGEPISLASYVQVLRGKLAQKDAQYAELDAVNGLLMARNMDLEQALAKAREVAPVVLAPRPVRRAAARASAKKAAPKRR